MLKKIRQARLKKAQEKELLSSIPSYFDHGELQWEAPEYLQHHRGTTWKIVMSLLLIAIIGFAIAFDSWTFALAMGTFGIVYFIVNRHQPKIVPITISSVGIKVGKRKYPYGKIKNFWLHYEPPYVKALHINVHGEIAGEIIIQLGPMSPAEVRTFLLDKIPELDGHHESVTDLLLRAFKLS